MTELSKRLSNEDSRFVFYGGSLFADEIVDAIESRQTLLKQSHKQLNALVECIEQLSTGKISAASPYVKDLCTDTSALIDALKLKLKE